MIESCIFHTNRRREKKETVPTVGIDAQLMRIKSTVKCIARELVYAFLRSKIMKQLGQQQNA